ncbi:hypothetical protein TYRP_002161 [Tyrophagus putrescentiae]|nr:hypothetical protein TYRP_002161 [Tyrophagus putrescentiae]
MTHLKLTLCYLPVTAADDVVAVVCSAGLPGHENGMAGGGGSSILFAVAGRLRTTVRGLSI